MEEQLTLNISLLLWIAVPDLSFDSFDGRLAVFVLRKGKQALVEELKPFKPSLILTERFSCDSYGIVDDIHHESSVILWTI